MFDNKAFIIALKEVMKTEEFKRIKEQINYAISDARDKCKNQKTSESILNIKVQESGSLLILIGKDKIGEISTCGAIEGACSILKNSYSVSLHQYWIERGSEFDTSTVQWRGKEYNLDTFVYDGKASVYLICKTEITPIYNFSECKYCKCNDSNIFRFSHNNRPVGF